MDVSSYQVGYNRQKSNLVEKNHQQYESHNKNSYKGPTDIPMSIMS